MSSVADIINGVESGELVVARTADLKNLFREVLAESAQDHRKGLMSRRELKSLLAIKDDKTLDRLLRDPECLIRRSKIQGKYIAESVYQEVDRLGR